MSRPSQYLVDKVITLTKVLDFFAKDSGDYMRSINERLAVFLAQMDFWDWEIENLIFSFDTFEERAKAWESSGHVSSYLSKQGILVKDKILVQMAQNNWWRDQQTVRPRLTIKKTKAGRNKKGTEVIEYEPVEKTKTVAPVVSLNVLIQKWNALVSMCEKRLLRSDSQHIAELGVPVLKSLDKYKKKERPATYEDQCNTN